MKIAILGSRGIPAHYSGFEVCVEEIAVRLAENGHKVSVYCRPHLYENKPRSYKSVSLVYLPTIRNKYLETFIHTLLSTLHVIFTGTSVIQYFGVGNSIFTILPRIFGKKTFINVDGLDWRRKKWPYPAKVYLRFCGLLSTMLPNGLITDSRVMAEYYKAIFNKSSACIAYGANITIPSKDSKHLLDKLSIEKNKYILFIGRLVPENNAHYLISAYNRLPTDLKLVILGEAFYDKEYVASLKKQADPKILFLGFMTGNDYRDICSNAYMVIEPSEASGTHTAILDAMASSNCVLVNNTPSNLETIGDSGLSYDGDEQDKDLKNKIEWLINNPAIVNEYKLKAVEHVKKHYSWDNIAKLYEKLYYMKNARY
jgi:glycosyltransferase involved in cell wall biosynthesis